MGRSNALLTIERQEKALADAKLICSFCKCNGHKNINCPTKCSHDSCVKKGTQHIFDRDTCLTCSLCNIGGHTLDKCRKLCMIPDCKNKTQHVFTRQCLVCTLCNLEGHSQERCRRRCTVEGCEKTYGIHKFDRYICFVCNFCKKQGHTENYCREVAVDMTTTA